MAGCAFFERQPETEGGLPKRGSVYGIELTACVNPGRINYPLTPEDHLRREKVKSRGFLILDAHLKPLYADPESIRILCYPNAASNPALIDGVVAQKIASFLPRDWESLRDLSALQFKSGRRNYHCRAFVLEDHWTRYSPETKIALLMERAMDVVPEAGSGRNNVTARYQDAFAFSPDLKYFAFSRAHREVFLSLRKLIREGRGTAVLLSQAGMGKTLLLEYLAQDIRGESEVAVFPGAFDNRNELVRGVMAVLGVDAIEKDASANLNYLGQWLLSRQLAGRRITLLCDDAQDYGFDTLESLFMLSDFQNGPQPLLQIVLAGRQGLLEKLNDSRLKSSGGRINICCRLSPLDESEVRSYIWHRLRIAGYARPMFSSAALSAIALYSRGIPLNINMICRHALSLAAAINLQTVDERIVADSAYDLVLRAQPADIWETPGPMSFLGDRRGSRSSKDRHGLRLVHKP